MPTKPLSALWRDQTSAEIINALATFIGTFAYVGYLKPASGTWGSLAALSIWWLAGPQPILIQIIMILAAFTAGLWASGVMEKSTGKHDPSEIVIDELAGLWIALAGNTFTPQHLIIAFLLFRLFDIIKPGPINRLQNLPGGWGVMMDDIGAGFVALALATVIGILL